MIRAEKSGGHGGKGDTMFLAIDIGNSNIVIGGYVGGKIVFTSRFATDARLEADQYAVQIQNLLALYGVAAQRIEGTAISSVVPGLTPVLARALRHLVPEEPVLLTAARAGDITIDIEHPPELGSDLLASAIAVGATRALPAVIVDMGTATKIIALDKGKVLRGVAIAPGLFLSVNTLVSGASLLQGVSMGRPAAAIGRNTAESLRSGVVYGNAAMLDGMVKRFADEMGGVASVVATGGAAHLVVPHCETDMEFCETLVLDGLYLAYGAADGGGR